MKKIALAFVSLMMVLSLASCKEKAKDETIFDKEGTFDTTETLKNVKVTGDKIILSNKVIEGDLVIESTGDFGELTLNGVDVKGKIVVNNPNAEYTIRLYDVSTTAMEVNQGASPLRLYASKKTNVPRLTSNGNVIITEQALESDGFNEVVIEGSPDGLLMLVGAGLQSLEIKNSDQYSIVLDQESMVSNAIANSQVSFKGKGSIDVLTANQNVAFENEPNTVIAKDGVLINDTNPNGTTTAATTAETTVKQTTKSVVTTKKNTTKVTTRPVTTTPVTTTTPVVTTPPNTKPVITGADTTINVGEAFDPLKGVTIYDKEDGGYITVTTSHIYSNNVNVNVVGSYNVIYSYTDKGGLNSSFTRKVTVAQGNKLATPKNLKVYMDSYGDVTVEWDAVSGVGSYDIYFNRTVIDNVSGSRTKYILLAKEITSARDFDIGVRAISKTDSVKDSDTAYTTFKYVKEKYDFPKSLYASSEAVNMLYRIDPIGVDESKIIATVLVMRDDSVVPNFQLMKGVTTSRLGKAEIPYDLSTGLELSSVFDEIGEYSIKITIENRSGEIQFDTFDIMVRSRSGSGGSTGGGTTRIADVDLSVGADWYTGATLEFTLSNDLNIRDGQSDISVEFDWAVRDGAEGIITLDSSDILSGTRVNAGELIKVVLNSRTTGVRALSREVERGSKVNVIASIYVTDKYGTVREANSNSIYIEY